MSAPETYPVGPQIALGARALGLDLGRALRRAGLPPDHFDQGNRGLTADQFFAIWQAAEDEASRPDLPLHLGLAMARGPMAPPIYGFASSPDIETGFARLAVFKPLVAPIRMEAASDPHGLTLRWLPLPGNAFSPLFALFELVFFLELCRIHNLNRDQIHLLQACTHDQHELPILFVDPALLETFAKSNPNYTANALLLRDTLFGHGLNQMA